MVAPPPDGSLHLSSITLKDGELFLSRYSLQFGKCSINLASSASRRPPTSIVMSAAASLLMPESYHVTQFTQSFLGS